MSINMKNIEEKIKASHSADSDSILGTYYRINPELTSPNFYHKPIGLLLLNIEQARIALEFRQVVQIRKKGMQGYVGAE